jgi:ATP synthase protein I
VRAVDPFVAIWKILAIQASVAITLPAFLLVFFGWPEARSGLLGGMVALIPNAYFAFRIAATKDQSAKEVVRAFYSGESIKIIITAGLFIFIFQLPNIIYGPLFAVFVAVILVFWFALLFSRTDSE